MLIKFQNYNWQRFRDQSGAGCSPLPPLHKAHSKTRNMMPQNNSPLVRNCIDSVQNEEALQDIPHLPLSDKRNCKKQVSDNAGMNK